uniref:Zinc finger FYVE domain-containing protein 16-like n=1 Tax=Sinocyclocheilus grahami TaxID=75366 RepID=A0A672SI37_SINGR
VDLLSSVDSRGIKSSAPPCPDRSLKPVCDLVNDTGSANLQQADSQEDFKELDVPEKQTNEVLLVDFESPVVSTPEDASNAGELPKHDSEINYNSFSLLDVILPAVGDPHGLSSITPLECNRIESSRSEDSNANDQNSSPCEVSVNEEDVSNSDPHATTVSATREEHAVSMQPDSDTQLSEDLSVKNPEDSAGSPSLEKEPSLSCLPMAVSMCGSLVASLDPQTAVIETKDEAELEKNSAIQEAEDDGSLQYLEESEGSNVSSSSQESSPLRTDATQTISHENATSPVEIQSVCTPNQESNYGGARPKQLSNQTTRPPSERHRTSHAEPNVAGLSAENGSQPPPYPGESPDPPGLEVEGLGSKQPPWVPDSEAPNCMNCEQKFTFTKRRHHCRACGKVYCANCCNRKCRLKYLDKEARVCVICHVTIQRAHERMMSPTGPSPNPNIPSEYCSTIPPMQQARAAGTLNSPPPTVMVPVSVLKHPGNDGFPREQKHVWFADGILPNGEVADTTKLSVQTRRSSQESSPVTPDPPGPDGKLPGECDVSAGGSSDSAAEVSRPPLRGPWDYGLLCAVGSCVQRAVSLVPEDDEGLPPLLITTGEEEDGDVLVEERPAACQILLLLEEGGPQPLTFVLNANLLVNVKIVTYDGKRCWCLSSNGLQGVGQKELVFIIECLPEENSLPRDVFNLYVSLYQDAQKGKFIEHLGNVTFTDSFLGSKDHGGVLFFTPTFQPLDGLALPQVSFLCGVLIQKLEVPWAKVFPLRLLLALGVQYNVYPCTLVSVRFRDSVFKETGHTIMNLLTVRLMGFQLKMLYASNFPLKGFKSEMVCGCLTGPHLSFAVTGASFVVFNGALKASSGFIAKCSIVEDGLMVQIPPETMEGLRQALRDQTDFQIPCGKADSEETRENVNVRWVDWTTPVNTGVTSPVDGKSLEGVSSIKIQQDSEFEMDGRTIRCTEVFYVLKSSDVSLSAVLTSSAQFQREIATASCAALCPHLSVFVANGFNSLALRVSTDSDVVEYQAGSGGHLLPQKYMNDLDGALIPVIHGGSSCVPHQAMDMEFFFYISLSI